MIKIFLLTRKRKKSLQKEIWQLKQKYFPLVRNLNWEFLIENKLSTVIIFFSLKAFSHKFFP